MRNRALLMIAALTLSGVPLSPGAALCVGGSSSEVREIVFATFAEDSLQQYEAMVLAESIRLFGGRFRNARIWLYIPDDQPIAVSAVARGLSEYRVEIRRSHTPADALHFPFAGKVFAAARAEAAAQGNAGILVWMDTDTIIWQEPVEFVLPDGVNLGYRPVMHKLIGSLYADPPDQFWSRLYRTLTVPETSLFPMVTPVDRKSIRPYFNAGLLVVRPERGILQSWPDAFTRLYTDSVFAGLCRGDRLTWIFLHQAALAGTILSFIHPLEMMELPCWINYPLFMHDIYPADLRPKCLERLVSARYDTMRKMPDMLRKLDPSSAMVEWMKARFLH